MYNNIVDWIKLWNRYIYIYIIRYALLHVQPKPTLPTRLYISAKYDVKLTCDTIAKDINLECGLFVAAIQSYKEKVQT